MTVINYKKLYENASEKLKQINSRSVQFIDDLLRNDSNGKARSMLDLAILEQLSRTIETNSVEEKQND